MSCRDWRSVALGTRHIQRQTLTAYEGMPGKKVAHEQWLQRRFATEAREEFEAWLVIRNRLVELTSVIDHKSTLIDHSRTGRGLVLLTLHFDSFFLGASFLAKEGGSYNFMASSITHDPRVDVAVQNHFETKYRSLEAHLNGGKIVNMEDGMRPFYRMLDKHQTLIILGDSPPLQSEPTDSDIVVNFLGAKRRLAGGALRMAQATKSDIGAYLCYYQSPGQYKVEVCNPMPADDLQSIQNVYDFFSRAIVADPGLWWGADLLPSMPIEKDNPSSS
ncbi:MAG: hypothetical protein CFE44_01700 [Burkholderiales bacterium PBB4]|nr:MAG: hypothetical protein CFE44_01700 [Burkholderiales bacterium PBB4]